MLRDGNIWKIVVPKGDHVEGEVADIEGKENFHRIQVNGGIYYTHPSLIPGGLRSGSYQRRAY